MYNLLELIQCFISSFFLKALTLNFSAFTAYVWQGNYVFPVTMCISWLFLLCKKAIEIAQGHYKCIHAVHWC